MGKLLFFDIDGTLILPDRPPRPAVIQAIRAARAKGNKVFLSTGRLESAVPDQVRAIGFDGGIYSAGGRVVVGDEIILDLALTPKLLRRITEILEENDIFYILEAGTGPYSGQSWQRYPYLTRESYASIKSRLDLLEPEEKPAGDPIYKMVFIAPSSDVVRPFIERLGEAAKVVVYSDPTDCGSPLPSGEITDPEIHKGRALLQICRHLGADPEDCIAFGDSMNDAEILRAAGLGIAVGNADEELKRIADKVCGSFAEDGIARALEEMGLTGGK